MACKTLIWNSATSVELLNDFQEPLKKICNINNHLFLLTKSHNVYHGLIEGCSQIQLELQKDVQLKDMDCIDGTLYGVCLNGQVVTFTESFERIDEVSLIEDSKLCPHGHTVSNIARPVNSISVGKYGILFLTESGQLWAKGDMHEIGINSDRPKRVNFFDSRFVYSAGVGDDFAVAIVSKLLSNDEDADSDSESVTMPIQCPTCMSTTSHLASPASMSSPVSERCPSTGLPMPSSYDIETTSTSSKSDSSKCSTDTEIQNRKASDRNIIFRNTEAAKDFLTRQFTRMSSAGEEYLVECTEKPTRIIKENVTHVASLVYDKMAATLSRHVSTNSESAAETAADGAIVANGHNEDEAQHLHGHIEDEPLHLTDLSMSRWNSMRLPRVITKDGLSSCWSLSQTTASERDASGSERHEAAESKARGAMVRVGGGLLNCEVWTWGNIVHGQLGLGDIIKRERPMIITKLSNIGARHVSVHSYHAAVITLDGRAFLWGRNDHNQVTVESNIDQSSPKQLPMANNTDRTLAVSCGVCHSTVLTSGGQLVYLGKESRKNIVNLCDRSKSTGEIGPTCLSTSSTFTALNLSPSNSYITPCLVQEQAYLESCLLVLTNVIKPLQKKSMSIAESNLYEQLCCNYHDLVNLTAVNVNSMWEHFGKSITAQELTIVKFAEEQMQIYRAYLNNFYSIVSINGISSITKVLEVPVSLYTLYKLLMGEMPLKRDKKTDELIVSKLLLEPFEHLPFYKNLTQMIVEKHCLKTDIVTTWNEFIDTQLMKKAESESTKLFWNNANKVLEQYKMPHRRLLRDSRTNPIFLQNASRFSTNWFVLFNDILLHMNGSTPTVHQLSTIWVEMQQLKEDTNNTHTISIKTPEDCLELYTCDPEQRTEWFHALQAAVNHVLGRRHAPLHAPLHAQVQAPPQCRNTSHTFSRGAASWLREATYRGRWQAGRMHGAGRLQWADGRVYVGQFGGSVMHGYGRMDVPSLGVYEGQWKDNQRNGFGVLKYSNGDVYKGYFKDDVPHGHGFLKQGHFMASSACLYIGDWNFGCKSGYGISDDIVTGEKYLGSWADSKKQGNGLMVTSDGVYYEGTFHQDALTGHGIMILEDGTHYEGDFKGAGVLAGKGTLTLQSGHKIEGSLTGSYCDGIKISNGTFSIAEEATGTPKSFGTLCTPVYQKWNALFKYFYQLLGVSDTNGSANQISSGESQKVWQNIAVLITNSHNEVMNRSIQLENTLNNLDTIPQFGKDDLNAESYVEIKQYLSKAFEYNYHPLGSLLSDLTVAYTTTYGGLRAHPLLLLHAVIELHYIIKKIYDIARLLFPALPLYGKDVHVDASSEESESINFRLLLYPIILPKVYSSLFTLYTLKNKSCEIQYWRRLREWNKQPDYTLMVFLSVDKKFLASDITEAGIDNFSKDGVYTESIETLQELKTAFSPIEKLHVIRQTFQTMTQFVQMSLGPKYRWNMDDLLPVFLYVVVRARIPQLGSEIDFIEDFIAPNAASGELSIMFTTLQACYQQILQEKVSIN